MTSLDHQLPGDVIPTHHLLDHAVSRQDASLPYVLLSRHGSISGAHIAFVDRIAAGPLTGLLHPDEDALTQNQPAVRRESFAAGRVALREAIRQAREDAASRPILRSERGAPQLPDGIIGSVSHKSEIAVAIAADREQIGDGFAAIGIDVEDRYRVGDSMRDIAPRILRDEEMRYLPSLHLHERHEATLLLFAMKEAVYKAIDPFVRRHVHFREVAIDNDGSLDDDAGVAAVHFFLPELTDGRLSTQVQWWKEERHLVAVAMSSAR